MSEQKNMGIIELNILLTFFIKSIMVFIIFTVLEDDN